MSTGLNGFTFISLLRDELEARGLSGLLESIARPGSGVSSHFLVPDVRGRDFFAAPARQAEVDRWWRRCVPPTAVPVYLLCHEPGLSDWFRGLDGVFMVAARSDRAAEYAAWSHVEAEPAEAPLALAGAVVQRFGVPKYSAHRSVAHVFDLRDAHLVADLRLEANLAPGSRTRFVPLLHVDGVRAETMATRSPASPQAVGHPALDGTTQQRPAAGESLRAARPGGKISPLRTRLPMLMRRHGKPARSRSGENHRLT